MLNELHDEQSSDETIYGVSMSFDVETRSADGNELVHKVFTFSYAREWETWVFQEYHEKRTPDTNMVSDRDWRQSRHIFWNDANESRAIDVPPEVADRLAEATGSESVTIQVPVGGTSENKYEQIYDGAES